MANEKPASITGLNTGWTYYNNIMAALILDEGTGTPVESRWGSTVTFSASEMEWATVNGNVGVRINTTTPAQNTFAVDFDGDVSADFPGVGTGDQGTFIFIGEVETADTTNVAHFMESSDAGRNFSIARSGPSNFRYEIGGGSSTWGDVLPFTNLAYNVLVATYDVNVAEDNKEAEFNDTDLANPPASPEGIGGAAHTAPAHIMANNADANFFDGFHLQGLIILDTYLDTTARGTFFADEWAWVTAAGGGSSAPIYSNHVIKLNR